MLKLNADAKMDSGYSRKAYEEQIQLRFSERVHEKVKERNEEIIYKLKEELERAWREVDVQAEENRNARQISEDEIRKLKTQLQDAQRKIEGKWGCCPVM